MPGLGRIVNHDPRSRMFQARTAGEKRSVLWPHRAPVLNQGNTSACTGFALAQLLNSDKFSRGKPLVNADALRFYSLATRFDDVEGFYPPHDTGSSGLAACKAGKKLGYLTGYTHAFGFAHFCASLQLSPMMVGTDWYEGMTNPGGDHFGHPTGVIEGGHEYLALGVDYARRVLTFLNSWSGDWGDGGRFYMTFDEFAPLLNSRGDAIRPLPGVAGARP